jgi:hypothetical protein
MKKTQNQLIKKENKYEFRAQKERLKWLKDRLLEEQLVVIKRENQILELQNKIDEMCWGTRLNTNKTILEWFQEFCENQEELTYKKICTITNSPYYSGGDVKAKQIEYWKSVAEIVKLAQNINLYQ